MADRQFQENAEWKAVNDAVILLDSLLFKVRRESAEWLQLMNAKDRLLRRLRTLPKWELK